MHFSNDELLQAIQGEDINLRNGALKQLYMDHTVNAKVRELIQTYQAHQLDADDILQEAIILLDNKIRSGNFQARSKVRTFLIGVCKNLIRSGGKKIERISYATAPTEMPDREETEESPEEQLVAEEKTDAAKKRDELLQGLLKEVTENCQEVLLLYYFKAQSLARVAEERGLKSAKQAKKAAKRCREQLRSKIQANPGLAHFLKESL